MRLNSPALVGYGLLFIAIFIGAAHAPEITMWIAVIGFWAFVAFGVWCDRKEKKSNNKPHSPSSADSGQRSSTVHAKKEKPHLTDDQRRALRVIAKVLDEQADEELDPWYRFLKRRSATKAHVIGRLPLWLVRRHPQQKD